MRGLVVDEEGAPLASATVRIEGIDKEIVTTERGEYWRLLVPGTYILSAVSQSEYGLLESNPTAVLITNHLGDGPKVVNLIARLKLPGRFHVSSYKAGDREIVEQGGETVVRQIFSGYTIGQARVVRKEEHVHAAVTIYHIVFDVEVILSSMDMVSYFEERWSHERIMRPASSLEQKKLYRRLNIFLEETFCAENVFNSGWSVCVAT